MQNQKIVYHLAVDIGASSGRHILGYLIDGELKTEEIYRFPNGVKNKDGTLIWDVKELFSHVVAGLKKAKELGKIPVTVGIDTWAVDYALLDKDDNLIGDVVAYRDSRTQNSFKEVEKITPVATLFEKTGIGFQYFNTVYQLYADKISGKINNARSFLMLPDYLNFLLTGVKKQEYTNASTTALVNAKTHFWDSELISKLGLPAHLFKELTKPASVVGEFSLTMQKEIGYNATVVLPPTHDTASAVESVDIKCGVPYISSGTWSLLGVKSPYAITDEKSCSESWSNECGPDYFRYQKTIIGLWLVQSLRKELCPDKDFADIAKDAEKSTYNAVVNVNDPVFFAPKSMKGAFDEKLKDVAEKPAAQADYFRLAYVSLAHCYKFSLQELKENTGLDFDTLYIVGGGAKNAFLNKLTEKICGIKVVALPIEATAIGNLKTQLAAYLKMKGDLL